MSLKIPKEKYGRLPIINDNMVNKLACFFLLSFLSLYNFEYRSKEGYVIHFQTHDQKTQQDSLKRDEGKDLYIKYCLTCHQTDGSGVPNMFPPIQKSDWVNGDKDKIINILLNGLQGDIDVNGESFSQIMPKQDYLTDLQIAQVLTYIRQNFSNNADTVQPEDVKNLRERK